jgi:Leucine Rich repeat
MKLLVSSMGALQAAKPKEKTAATDAEAQAIAQIEKAGGSVRQIAQNDQHREVDFHLQGASCVDEQLAPLGKIKNIVSLNLGKTSITDAGLAYVKPLTGLVQLHLEQTKVTDKGLAQLKGLTSLTYLNLYGCAITDAGLAQLTGLKSLHNLYVWQTKVTDEGVKKLKQALPGVDIDKGW